MIILNFIPFQNSKHVSRVVMNQLKSLGWFKIETIQICSYHSAGLSQLTYAEYNIPS